VIDLSLRSDQLYTAVQLQVCFARSDGSAKSPVSGTGFVVVDREQSLAALTTCRHLVDPKFQAPGRRRSTEAGLSLISVQGRAWNKHSGSLQPFVWRVDQPEVRFHERAELDVAALDLNDLEVVEGSNSLDFWFNREILATRADFDGSTVSAHDMVVTIGYPGLNGQTPEAPLSIPGMVSSDPRVESPIPGLGPGLVAYHAFSRSGLSGSPVVAPTRGFKTEGTILIETPGYRPTKVVGINSGHMNADSSDPMALSFFCPSWAILDLLDNWR